MALSLRRVAIFLLALGVVGFTSARAQGQLRRWHWTADEVKRVESLEKQVTRRDGFYLLSAGRFNIKTDVSKRFAAETSLFMDMFHDGYCKFLFETLKITPSQPAGRNRKKSISPRIPFPIKPTVVIFAREASYRKLFPNGSGGTFRCRWNRKGRCTKFHIYCYMQAYRYRRRTFKYFNHSVLLHEGTHCMLHAMARRKSIPLWFDEGFAQLVECWDLRAMLHGKVKLRYGRWANKRALKHPGKGWYQYNPSLTRLIGIKKWNTDNMGIQTRYRYAIAWNFMEFLFATNAGRKSLRLMLKRLVHEKKNTPLLTKRDCWSIEPAWHSFLKKSMT